LTGLRFRAADVNASNSVNASDALVINRRYSNVISTFPAGEWVFDTATIVTNGSAITRNLKAMCYGDVNGSFIPGAARQGFGEFELIEDRHDPSGVAGGGSLGYVDGIIGVTMLRSSGQARVGALSLDIAWPDFLGDPVVFSQLGDQEMVYARTGGRLRLAWNDVKGVDLSNNQPVVEIHHRCGILPESWSWNVAAGSEWADPLALPLQELGLRIPAPRKVANADEALFYPNPTDGQVQVVFGANLQALLNTVANQTGSLQWLVRDLSGRVYGMFPFVSGRSDHHMQSSSPGFQASSVLDLSPLRSGLYTLELYGSSGISLMKPHRLIRR
jgi:hypothetical protein